MDNIDLEGVFWLAANPDEKVAGRLKVDGQREMELDLIGSFFDPRGAEANGPMEPVRIQGIAGNKSLTLDNCLQTGQTIRGYGITQERYHVPVVFDGAHFDETEVLEFNELRLRLQHLEHWVGYSKVKVEYPKNQYGSYQLRVDHSPTQRMAMKTNFGELELLFNYTARTQSFEFAIEEHRELKVGFHRPQSLEQVLQVCSALQDLVTMGVDSPTSVVDVTVFHSNMKGSLVPGEVFRQPISLYTQYPGSYLHKKQKIIIGPNMLFTFDDIGGLKGVDSWLEISTKFQPVIGALMNSWYLPLIYLENRFFNVITAAETLERIRLQEQIFPFRVALNSLANRAGSTFMALVDDVDAWINKVVATRVKNVVHRGLHESEDPDLYLLSESVYFLVVLCLLRECGVAEEILANFKRHRRFRWLAGKLRSTHNRA